MESIKLVHELSILGNHLKIGLLMHFFKNFNPEDSNALKICLNSVYIPALEASDYRSAYHQLCDWLYGWNVSDSSQFSSMSVSGDDNPFKTTRAPRDINLDAEVELIECDRLLSTFQTLFQISRRQLIKQHADIEHNLPRIGEGLVGTATMGPGQPKPTKNDSIENQSITDAWLRRQSEVSLGGYDELGDELDDEDNSSIADNRKSSVVGRDTVKIRRGRRGSVTVKAATQYTSDDELAEEIVTESPIKEEYEGAAEFSDFKLGEEGGEVVTKTETEAKEVSTSNVASPDSPKASIKSPKDQAKKTVGPSVMELPKAGVPPGSSGSDGSGGATALEESGQPLPFSFYRPKGGNLLQGPDPNDTVSQTQKDIIFVLIQVDKSTDYTIVNIVNILVILTFSEIVRKKDVHLRYCSQVHELAAGKKYAH